MLVRAALAADIPAITAIYDHHVRHGLASFEIEPPDAAEMANRRLAIVGQGFPYLVAEDAGRLVGYAYASNYRPRPGYRFAVEDSIYVDPALTGRGIGKVLLPVLIEACTALGKRQMVAVIGDSANHGSIKLHAAFGFRHVGLLPSIGFKLGRWVDGVIMQRALGAGDSTLP